ncbi:metal ABC transporter permease, partial [Bacillus sp. SIMBA_161]
VSAVIGLYFSYTYNLASGATIVLAATALFIIAFVFSPKHGLLWKKISSKKKQTELANL